jgi:hypothetical protein
VSSLLRLSPPAGPRLPKARDVSGWVERAAHALGLSSATRQPTPLGSSAFAASSF